MYCAKCDRNFPNGQFCPECGTTLLSAPTQVQERVQTSATPKKSNRQAIIIGASVLGAALLLVVGFKVLPDIAANDAKDKKISQALEDCSLTYTSGADLITKRHAILTDDSSTSITYNDMACVITALGGPSSSSALQLIKDNYSTHDYIYGDVKIELFYQDLVDTMEIWVQ